MFSIKNGSSNQKNLQNADEFDTDQFRLKASCNQLSIDKLQIKQVTND